MIKMSTRFDAKITLTSWFFFVHLLVLASLPGSTARTEDSKTRLSKYFIGKCVGRGGKRFPSTLCSRYIYCEPGGRTFPTDCKSPAPVFNITSRQCVKDTTPPCQDTKKVAAYKWLDIDPDSQDSLEQNIMPSKPTPKQNYTDLTEYENYLPYNTKFGVLLRTRYLAVKDGDHMFRSECIGFCKLWIRATECKTPELVLHQKTRKKSIETVEYYVQKNFTMNFGTFYHLDIVHIGNGKDTQFKIGKEMSKTIENIDSVLLRFPAKMKCPNPPTIAPNSVRPSSTTTVSPTDILSFTFSKTSTLTRTSSLTGISTLTGSSIQPGTPTPTKLLAPATTIGVPTSSTKTEPNQTAIKSTATQQNTTPTTPKREPTITSPKSVEDLANMVEEKYGLSSNQTNQSSSTQLKDEALLLFKDVDDIGKSIAENWTKRGNSSTTTHKDFVMEVHFPISNYTFPRPEILHESRKVDQIYIPAKALQTNREFKRRVFSTIYCNLHDKIPRSYNVVETETNRIHGSYVLNSRVIACTAIPGISGLPGNDIVIRLAHLTTNFSLESSPICAFLKWNGERKRSNAIWSTEGCILDETLSNRNVSVCRCNHLTHFGILMQVKAPPLSPKDVQALSVITYIGCALSLVAVCLTVLAIMLLPGARSDRNFIHVNLAVAIGLAQVTFLAGIDETGHEAICTIVAALLHYFLLVAFSWMLIEGIFLHILIVKVFHDHLPKKRFYVTFCWGVPLVVVLLSVNLLRDGYGTEGSCWLSIEKYTIWTFSGPVILVMIINIIILCKVMKEINSLRTSDGQDTNVRSIRYGVRSTVILLPLLGLTWIFGLICVNDSLVVFQYLFTIFNSLQGLFIFLFHCVFNSEVRKAFWRKVDIWFTNHNNPFGHHGNSFKKSKDDPSSIESPDKDNKIPTRNGLSMYSFNGLSERERRKLSTTTASTCLESWPHKLSLTPSLENGPYSSRFTPSLSSDDIKYQPIYKQSAGQKRISPKSFDIKPEDLNGNTRPLECDLIEQANQSLEDNGRSSEVNSTQNIEEANFVQKRHPGVQPRENQQTANLKPQKIAPNFQQNIENPESNKDSYVQKHWRQDLNGERKPDETGLNKTHEKPQPSKKPSRDSLVGIGGKHSNAGDRAGHVRIIDVNSSTKSHGTKL